MFCSRIGGLLSLTLIASQFLAGAIANGQTVAAYNFDEGAGTMVTDYSSFGNTGTVNGATWTPLGRFAGALNYDGISNWVTVNDSDSLDLSTGMTLEAWVYPTAPTGTWATVLLKEAPPGANLAYHLQSDPTNRPISFITTDISGLQGVTGPDPLVLNTWTHLAATYDGATLSLYVNGVFVATQPITGTILPSIGPLRIGGNSIWGEYFAGTIDNVRIYNRALSQTEIQSDMNRPVGNCLLSSGYWMNHPQAWCVPSIQVGCSTYNMVQAILIMRRNSSQDKTYSLAQQLIAAKLNIACKNSSTGCITSSISDADNWLCAHPVGSGVRASSSAWRVISASYNALENYNRGNLCAPSCDPIF